MQVVNLFGQKMQVRRIRCIGSMPLTDARTEIRVFSLKLTTFGTAPNYHLVPRGKLITGKSQEKLHADLFPDWSGVVNLGPGMPPPGRDLVESNSMVTTMFSYKGLTSDRGSRPTIRPPP